MRQSGSLCIVLVLPCLLQAQASDFFESKVRPLLVQHCIGCHGSEKQKANLRLDSKAGWQTGGENGPALIPGKPDESLLVKAIRHTGDLQMPPGKKLAANDVATLVAWIQQGAIDPRDGASRLGGMTLEEAKKWWAFQPLRPVAVPKNDAITSIDAFLRERQSRTQTNFAKPADRRALIRRATYDLTGLPPTKAEVDAFLADTSPEAFAKVIDRLLASPQYGERWGRHWLDLVRYADTAGENSDHPLPHAWRYRNWVIDAFNADQPYDEFLKDQLAGDLRASRGKPEQYAPRIVATGFLALARRFGHEIDKDIHLTHEDNIDTIGKALLGLSLGCARCHDHKYDAITAKDYYALYGILDSTRLAFPGCEPQQQPRDLIPLLTPDEYAKRIQPLLTQLANVDRELQQLRQENLKQVQATRKPVQEAKLLAEGQIADGGSASFTGLPKTIAVQPGTMLQLSIAPLKNHGADSTLVEWEIHEVGGEQRRWSVADLLDSFGTMHETWALLDGREGAMLLPERLTDFMGKSGLNIWRNSDTPSAFVNASKDTHAVWTKLPPRAFYLHPAPNGPVAVAWISPIAGEVRVVGTVRDVHPGGPDGIGWAIRHVPTDLRPSLTTQRQNLLKKNTLEQQKATLEKARPPLEVAYAVAERTPKNARLHLKGDPEKLGPEVPRRWLEVFGATQLPATEGSGRLALADWIAHKDNPLTARVFVNRIWQHHFGRGFVSTPNDFGSRGMLPSHPELLDWLTSEFIRGGWKIKPLHRQIMLTQAYQQSSQAPADTIARDPANECYTRAEPRRLTAEELRDSVMSHSGALDLRPALAHPFPPEATWNYTQHQPFSTFFETNKRSVYMVSLRNRRQPWMAIFDGADPNTTTPQRQVTTVPTQALFFLNDPFFHTHCTTIAQQLEQYPSPRARLQSLYQRVLQREPHPKELELGERFVSRYAEALATGDVTTRQRQSWAAFVRVLVAGNEYLYLD